VWIQRTGLTVRLDDLRGATATALGDPFCGTVAGPFS
jgi:hypothetical protein